MLILRSILKSLAVLQTVSLAKCSIDGRSYMDPIDMKPKHDRYLPGEDPCNPLYWYPRNIPEYCSYRHIPIPDKVPIPPLPMPLPVPVPVPPPSPIPMPFPPPPASLPFPPAPFALPIVPTNPIMSVPPHPYSYVNNPQQIGMVPGLPGLVTKDGGVNILPFSDAYSDLIENHKNRMIRRRLKKLIEEYEGFPSYRRYRRLRKYYN